MPARRASSRAKKGTPCAEQTLYPRVMYSSCWSTTVLVLIHPVGRALAGRLVAGTLLSRPILDRDSRADWPETLTGAWAKRGAGMLEANCQALSRFPNL